MSPVKYLEQRVEELFKGSRKYLQEWNLGCFLLSLRRGEEKVTGQWILNLNFLQVNLKGQDVA